MKQNERILVYLVTGFLAVILIAAVFFGQDGKPSDKKTGGVTPRSMGDLIGAQLDPQKGEPAKAPGAPGDASKQAVEGAANGAGTPAEASGGRSPLVAQQLPAISERVAQYLGVSSRERDWRRVTAREGDSLELLVRRWCGARDPFLADAMSVNEDKLQVLRPGDAVLVPWVDDDKVWAAYEARQPKLLSGGSDSIPTGKGGPNGVGGPANGGGPTNSPAPDASPAFRVPGAGAGEKPANGANGTLANGTAEAANAAGTQSYTVKDKDSLWKIAAGIRGKLQAEKVLGEIRVLNPGLSDRLQPGQKLVVPAR